MKDTETKNARDVKNPGRFETWCKRKAQTERDDDIGRVTRWVRRQIEAGEWFDSKSLGTCTGPAPDERLIRTWRWYLRDTYGLSDDSMEIFERVFNEWREARDRYKNRFVKE